MMHLALSSLTDIFSLLTRPQECLLFSIDVKVKKPVLLSSPCDPAVAVVHGRLGNSVLAFYRKIVTIYWLLMCVCVPGCFQDAQGHHKMKFKTMARVVCVTDWCFWPRSRQWHLTNSRLDPQYMHLYATRKRQSGEDYLWRHKSALSARMEQRMQYIGVNFRWAMQCRHECRKTEFQINQCWKIMKRPVSDLWLAQSDGNALQQQRVHKNDNSTTHT